ncbi:hypothetical protein BCR32DRAFT_113788 [Anaeromyces robustus]|uniref:Uncharacterized protein n=1 Tax=Anaeromyces robustus TaxID=1754192 RepID=A0A1Y1VW98_9FUNG|nr:hypothetical protein BCR32DRAFT_113788 [Anaeromyces robustus]|eukprot:ORX65569.1 hypothetical protein BCR32DRAFT_113788 [Anaeromyces robustus]
MLLFFIYISLKFLMLNMKSIYIKSYILVRIKKKKNVKKIIKNFIDYYYYNK